MADKQEKMSLAQVVEECVSRIQLPSAVHTAKALHIENKDAYSKYVESISYFRFMCEGELKKLKETLVAAKETHDEHDEQIPSATVVDLLLCLAQFLVGEFAYSTLVSEDSPSRSMREHDRDTSAIQWSGDELEWISPSVADVAQDVLIALYTFKGLRSADALLDSVKGKLFARLRECMKGDAWKESVHTKYLLFWCVSTMKHPHLSDVSDAVLLSVALVKDHEVHNKLVGLRTTKHLLAELNPTEIRWHGPLLLDVSIVVVSCFVCFRFSFSVCMHCFLTHSSTSP